MPTYRCKEGVCGKRVAEEYIFKWPLNKIETRTICQGCIKMGKNNPTGEFKVNPVDANPAAGRWPKDNNDPRK